MQFVRNVYQQLVENGQKYEIRNVGHYALESRRIEQGIPAWGSELTPSVLPQNAGLNSLVDLSKVSCSVSTEVDYKCTSNYTFKLYKKSYWVMLSTNNIANNYGSIVLNIEQTIINVER